MDGETLAQIIIFAVIIGAAILWKFFTRKGETEATADAAEWEKTLKNLLQGGKPKETPPAPQAVPRAPVQPPAVSLPLQPAQQPVLSHPLHLVQQRPREESLLESRERESERSTPAQSGPREPAPARFASRAAAQAPPQDTHDVYSTHLSQQQEAYEIDRDHPATPETQPAVMPAAVANGKQALKTAPASVATPFAPLAGLPPLQLAFIHAEIFSRRRVIPHHLVVAKKRDSHFI